MPYTMEDFRRDVLKQRLEQMSPEALLKISPFNMPPADVS